MLVKKSRPDDDENPYGWWQNNSGEFPLLAKEVTKYLLIPATSVDCERSASLEMFSDRSVEELHGRTTRLLLMIKANENRQIARECRSWSPAELKRYSCLTITVSKTMTPRKTSRTCRRRTKRLRNLTKKLRATLALS